MTDKRIFELAELNLGYDRIVRTLDFARAIEREVQATRAMPRDTQENPLLDVLKLAIGLLSLHGYDAEAKDLGSRARTIVDASAPKG